MKDHWLLLTVLTLLILGTPAMVVLRWLWRVDIHWAIIASPWVILACGVAWLIYLLSHVTGA